MLETYQFANHFIKIRPPVADINKAGGQQGRQARSIDVPTLTTDVVTAAPNKINTLYKTGVLEINQFFK